MSRFVEVSPIPEGSTVAKIREVFHAFSLHQVCVSDGKAFLEFEDQNDIESLDWKFTDCKVEELGGADINLLPEDFKFPQSNQTEINEQKKSEEAGWQPVTNDQPKQKIEMNPIFLVVKECDADEVRNISIEDIKKKIFGKFNIGRVAKWNRDVYIEFFDENQIETLDSHFPKLNVPRLGSNSSIDRVDQNFDLEVVQKQIEEHQKQEKQKEEARKRQQEMEKKAAQMENIMRKQAQDEERQRIAQQEIKRRRQEEEKRELQRVAEQQRLAEIEAQKVRQYLDKKKDEATQFVQQKTAAAARTIENLNLGDKKSVGKSSTIFWGVVVLLWSAYVIFM